MSVVTHDPRLCPECGRMMEPKALFTSTYWECPQPCIGADGFGLAATEPLKLREAPQWIYDPSDKCDNPDCLCHDPFEVLP